MVLFATTEMTHAKPKSDTDNDQGFQESLVKMLNNHRGEVAAAYKHLKTGKSWRFNADEPMPTASLIKLPIMAALYRAAAEGDVDLGAMVTLEEEDKVPGSGILTTHFSPGATLSVRDAVQLMIAYSDNTATNLVIDQIGLPATSAYMQELGFPETQLHAKVFRRDTSIAPERSIKYGLGSTTASDMIKLLEMLHSGKLGDESATNAMMEHLLACDHNSTAPRFLPEGTKVAHKTGSVSNSRTDAGIILSPEGPIAYCLLTTENKDRSWGDDNEAELLAAEYGRALYAHFNEDAANLPAVARVLKIGDDGELVESLQRTLNSKFDAADQIGVDGDFGPNTEKAVRRFQKQAGVEQTGEVGPDTWRALGPLLTEDQQAEVPPPEEVNAGPIEKDKPDPLDGPPLVTSAAWAIADGETGEVLWGYNDSTVREPASITKIMTAHLVTKLAEQDPAVLDETITFSKAADETSGSTSAVKERERLSVKHALYGLMLPSGNDMSVALAEHFGPRLVDKDEDKSALEKFVEAMNAEADRLGMSKTEYRNPHGLPHEEHVTTAADMVKLAHAVMQNDLMREVVSTARYGATLDSVDGYTRNVVWRNSNRLLGIEGFDGIKTGTTGAAGACLVSTGVRNGRRLIMVTLGATSGDARYTDSRNLYRWAWGELEE